MDSARGLWLGWGCGMMLEVVCRCHVRVLGMLRLGGTWGWDIPKNPFGLLSKTESALASQAPSAAPLEMLTSFFSTTQKVPLSTNLFDLSLSHSSSASDLGHCSPPMWSVCEQSHDKID